jgi:hypothetical protein
MSYAFVGRGSFELSKYILLIKNYGRKEFYDSYFIIAYTCEVVCTHDRAEVEGLTSFGKYKLNSVLSQYIIVLIKKLAVTQLVKINSRKFIQSESSSHYLRLPASGSCRININTVFTHAPQSFNLHFNLPPYPKRSLTFRFPANGYTVKVI